MNCVLEGNNVKAFGQALHAMSRIGDELWLDPTVNGLALRSVNNTHSAYTCFLFSPLFFQHYSLGSESEQDNTAIKCKLIMKYVLPLFRCLTSVERKVERCQISLSSATDRVIIQFFCRHGITKTHNLCFQESEALEAVFSSHLCPSLLKAPARLFGDMVMHFSLSQEEITLSVNPLRVRMRNNHVMGKDYMKMMHTEVSLHPDEFDHFQVGVDSDLTFCLKEIRGFLSFAESHSLPVSVHFGTAGKPVRFFMENMVLEASVVLATVIDSEHQSPSQSIEATVPITPRCVDAAAVPVVSQEPDGGEPQDAPAETELIGSSQGSPAIHPPAPQLLPRIDDPDGLTVPDGACVSAATTPASTPICSLLFRALSSEQGEDDYGRAATLPVLACHSDAEEDMQDD